MFSDAVSVLFLIGGARGGGCPLQVEHHASGGGEWGADMGEKQRGNNGKQEIKIKRKDTNTNMKRNYYAATGAKLCKEGCRVATESPTPVESKLESGLVGGFTRPNTKPALLGWQCLKEGWGEWG